MSFYTLTAATIALPNLGAALQAELSSHRCLTGVSDAISRLTALENAGWDKITGWTQLEDFIEANPGTELLPALEKVLVPNAAGEALTDAIANTSVGGTSIHAEEVPGIQSWIDSLGSINSKPEGLNHVHQGVVFLGIVLALVLAVVAGCWWYKRYEINQLKRRIERRKEQNDAAQLHVDQVEVQVVRSPRSDPSSVETHSTSRSYYAGSVRSTSNVRRRLATPFAQLVDKLEISVPPLHVETHHVLHEEPDVVERILSMDGIEYVLGASCIAQLLWCALGYYLYKRCTAPKEAASKDKHQAVPAPAN